MSDDLNQALDDLERIIDACTVTREWPSVVALTALQDRIAAAVRDGADQRALAEAVDAFIRLSGRAAAGKRYSATMRLAFFHLECAVLSE